jgi:hypothetical protein
MTHRRFGQFLAAARGSGPGLQLDIVHQQEWTPIAGQAVGSENPPYGSMSCVHRPRKLAHGINVL